jgi:hypothetical protein
MYGLDIICGLEEYGHTTGVEQWQIAVPEIVAANVAVVRAADASPAATRPKYVNVIVMEVGSVVG